VTPVHVTLGYGDLALAASLVLVNGALSFALRLGLERRLFWAALRMSVQLLLVGFVLKWVFADGRLYVVIGVLVPMTLIAGISAVRRAERTFPGMYLTSIVSVWVSAWLISGFALGLVLRSDPWYAPQYAVPLTGLVLGNSLTGISLALDRFTAELVGKRAEVEVLLSLGATRWEAARDALRQSLRAGLIPMLNAMLVSGIVSLPGMMTGQLLSGADPAQAARYQILVMFLLAASTALGTMGVVLLSYRRLFNDHHQFRYDLISRRRSHG
jgi:putative ABC transport system permease protein